ncbi:MAG: class I SAM-dependent methyltransferase [Candidatus Dormibacteria bacterium]
MRFPGIVRRTSPRDVFERIYEVDHWKGGSGVGSAPEATQRYREVLRRVLDELHIRSVVDLGCGDWQCSGLVDWSGIDYVGVDVVPGVIRNNELAHGAGNISFLCRDALRKTLPAAELLIAKDVLQHWRNRDIIRFLGGGLRRYRYALLTNDISSVHWQAAVNTDIETGAWRTLDLTQSPFNMRPLWSEDYPVADGDWVKRISLIA